MGKTFFLLFGVGSWWEFFGGSGWGEEIRFPFTLQHHITNVTIDPARRLPKHNKPPFN